MKTYTKRYTQNSWDKSEDLCLRRFWFEEKEKSPLDYIQRVVDLLNKQFNKDRHINSILHQVRLLKKKGEWKYCPPEI